jgi:hypothetical protein
MSDCDIDSYYYGIVIQPGAYGSSAVHLFFDNVTVNVGTSLPDSGPQGSAVVIAPLASAGEVPLCVGQVVFTSCAFEYGASSVSTAAPVYNGGVYINGSAGVIDTVRFVSCYSARWPMPGLTVDVRRSEVDERPN